MAEKCKFAHKGKCQMTGTMDQVKCDGTNCNECPFWSASVPPEPRP